MLADQEPHSKPPQIRIRVVPRFDDASCDGHPPALSPDPEDPPRRHSVRRTPASVGEEAKKVRARKIVREDSMAGQLAARPNSDEC